MQLWKYHAAHHSSEDLEWISAAHFHPINLFFGSVLADVVMLLAGISPNIFVVLGPIAIAHSAFVHANLDWTLGPFKHVIASPVFHRWHHTADERGGEKNFAATFPVLDLNFGTLYVPKGVLPDRYGIADKEFPAGFGAQLSYPFKTKPTAAQKPAPPIPLASSPARATAPPSSSTKEGRCCWRKPSK